MKKLILPQERSGYTPQGIYALPKDERRDAFNKQLKNSSDELIDYRISARERIRGDIS